MGPGQALDTYYAAFGFVSAWVGGVSVAGIYYLPAMIQQQLSGELNRSNQAGNGIISIMFAAIIMAFLSAIIFINGPTARVVGVSLENFELLVFLVCMGAVLSVLAASLGAIGNAHGHALGSIILSAVPPASMAIYLLSARFFNAINLAEAQLIGISVQVIALGWLYRGYWSFLDVSIKIIIRTVLLLPIVGAGSLCFSSYSAIDAWIAPGLGVGVLSNQALAQRLLIAFGAVLSIGPFLLSTKRIGELLSSQNNNGVWIFILRIGSIISIICLVASSVTPSVGHWAIGMLFERGAFTSADTNLLTSIVGILLIGGGPMLTTTVAFRALYVMDHKLTVAALSMAWVFLYITSVNILSIWAGSLTLAISYSVTWVFIVVATLCCLYRALR